MYSRAMIKQAVIEELVKDDEFRRALCKVLSKDLQEVTQ